MQLHPNAALTPRQRRRMCVRIDNGMDIAAAAEEFRVSRPTAHKWYGRWQDGDRQLLDRSSAPGTCPHKTDPETEQQVVKLRKRHGWGPDRLANHTEASSSSCWRIIGRNDTGEDARTVVGDHGPGRGGYEAIGPGELVHVDTKKLARIPDGGGWRKLGRQAGRANRAADPEAGGFQFLHAAVDDHSRLAYAELLEAEDAPACAGFWQRAARFFAANGITVVRLLTDNAWAYTKAQAFADTLQATQVDDHWTIRPYRPQTNGKVERFNRTLVDEWAHAYFWTDNHTRHQALPQWLHWYNHHRDHSSLQRKPPMARVNNAAVCNI